MNTVAIKSRPRPKLGTKIARQSRREGLIPCVLYGGEDIIHFNTTYNEIRDLVYTPDFKIAEVEVEGKTYRCIIKEVQFHPVKENILHIDFLQLIEGRPVKVELPVHCKGNSPGVRAGGKLIQKMRRVKVKATPENLVEELELDISNLNLGQSIRVRDITVPEGVEILSAPGTPVASVEVPRALRGAAAGEEAVEEGAEEGAEAGEEATAGE
ncbi:MAG: 50S ribosomal protein L25 [Bacteroidetes bacterium]|nr:MAG: 50S ribosomal protein L25 [Bacteroidota bacterium]